MLARNKSFCPLPWVNLSTDPDGSIKPCCVSTEHIKKEDGTLYNLGSDTIDSIYNSSHFQEIRKKMVEGEYVKGCEKCYESEKYSSISSRLTYNMQYKLPYRDLSFKKVAIRYFDLRFGNLCNLKCRSCNPMSSNQIAREVIEINDDLYTSYNNIPKGDFNNWYKTEIFKTNLESQIPNIDYLYLTGGEPTLVEENKNFIRKLIEQKQAHKITLKISTNLTNLNKEFFSLLSNFRYVIFFASIDGFNQIQEYLRYPSNWKTINENINKIVESKNFNLIATPVIQILNLNQIINLFEYLENINREHKQLVVNIDPLILEYPNYLNIKNLPLEYKIKCWNKIDEWLNTKCHYQNQIFLKKLEGIKNLCFEDNSNKLYLEHLKHLTNILDNHRKQNLSEVNPELHSLLQNI